MNETTTIPAPEYSVGDRVMYRGDPENIWTIGQIKLGERCWWVWAEQNGTKQNFPAGVFTKTEAKKLKAPAPVAAKAEPVAKKPRKGSVGDGVASLLVEAESVEQCWVIAEMAGLDIEETRAKIGHLSNGLQRMGIGNRLRKRHKDGQFDPESIVWTPDGFMYRADCPDFNDEVNE